MPKNRSLDKTISTLEMELTAARTRQTDVQHLRQQASNHSIQKAFVVIGINTAFSSKRRRDSIRETWLPKGTLMLPLILILIQKGIVKVLNCSLVTVVVMLRLLIL